MRYEKRHPAKAGCLCALLASWLRDWRYDYLHLDLLCLRVNDLEGEFSEVSPGRQWLQNSRVLPRLRSVVDERLVGDRLLPLPTSLTAHG